MSRLIFNALDGGSNSGVGYQIQAAAPEGFRSINASGAIKYRSHVDSHPIRHYKTCGQESFSFYCERFDFGGSYLVELSCCGNYICQDCDINDHLYWELVGFWPIGSQVAMWMC